MRWGMAVFGLACLSFCGMQTACGQVVISYPGLPKYEVGA